MSEMSRIFLAVPLALALAGADEAAAQDQAAAVEATERAFAQTMADRDFEAFKAFLSEEAVFFNGEQPLVGAEAVAAAWAGFFEAPAAPFSWAPETVVVLQSGTLAHSSGPVFDPTGQRVARFNSVWRRDEAGAWKIVFDKGSPVCPPPAPPAAD